jgi:ribosomal protein S18 acetylase RimI-like enzyme
LNLPIHLRAATPGDRDFLFQVFTAAGPALELQFLPESPLRSQLLQTQFDGWRAGYSAQYGAGGLKIVEESGVPFGYVWLYEEEEEQRIVDLAFAPAARGKGLGTTLVNRLVAAAHAVGKPMRASVAKSNDGSLRFNLRLGAVITSETPTHWAIEWPLP